MKKKTAPTAPNGKGVMFNMRVQRDLYERMKAQAELEHRTYSNMIQVFIEEGLNRRAETEAAP